MRLPALSELRAYRNEPLIQYFCYHHPDYSPPEAQQLLQDLLGWMWLTIYRKEQGRKTFLFGPLLNLDKLWHVFILHTRDYISFSEQYFQTYFHHDVEPVGHEYQLSADELAEFLDDCFDYLGEDWVQRHFAEAFA